MSQVMPTQTIMFTCSGRLSSSGRGPQIVMFGDTVLEFAGDAEACETARIALLLELIMSVAMW